MSTDDAYTDGNTIIMVPKVSGYVVDLFVSDITRVKRGDLLLRIDPRDYQTAAAQARAQLVLAQAQLGIDASANQQHAASASLENTRAQLAVGLPATAS